MEVWHLMSPGAVTVGPEESVARAARLMERHGVGALPVCDGEGRVKGILTDRDVAVRCVALGESPEETPVGQIMSRHVLTIPPGADARQAAQFMAQGQVRRLPVVEDGVLQGVISLGDVARCQACHLETLRALEEICREGAPGEG